MTHILPKPANVCTLLNIRLSTFNLLKYYEKKHLFVCMHVNPMRFINKNNMFRITCIQSFKHVAISIIYRVNYVYYKFCFLSVCHKSNIELFFTFLRKSQYCHLKTSEMIFNYIRLGPTASGKICLWFDKTHFCHRAKYDVCAVNRMKLWVDLFSENK